MKQFSPEPRPRILKTNICKIAQYVTKRITDYGYDVFFSFSHKSSSRYLEVKLSDSRKIIVRIADHPANKNSRGLFQFDIHTKERRNGSLDYIEFIDVFKQIIGERRKHG